MNPEDFRKNIKKWESLRDDGTISEAACQREIDRLFAAMRGDEHGAHGAASPFPAVGTQVGGRAVQEGELLGTQDQRYRVHRLIGQGSYGEVYLASDERLLEPYGLVAQSDLEHIRQTLRAQGEDALFKKAIVALKLLRGEHTQSEIAVRALEREAERLQQLRHPGIVQVNKWLRNERGGADDRRHFLVMEWLDGQTLDHSIAQRIKQHQRWELEEAVALIERIAAPLKYAYEWQDNHGHALRLVHRDLKPQNIILLGQAQPGDKETRPLKILDFGIAGKARDSGTLGSGTLQAQQSLAAQGDSTGGTPGYLAPELQGAANVRPDPKQDLYSLAVIYYQLHEADGQLPYNSRQLRSPLDRHPTPQGLEPDSKDSDENKAKKAALAHELNRALAYDPNERQANAWEFAAQLKRALVVRKEQPTSPTPPAPRAQPPAPNPPTTVAVRSPSPASASTSRTAPRRWTGEEIFRPTAPAPTPPAAPRASVSNWEFVAQLRRALAVKTKLTPKPLAPPAQPPAPKPPTTVAVGRPSPASAPTSRTAPKRWTGQEIFRPPTYAPTPAAAPRASVRKWLVVWACVFGVLALARWMYTRAVPQPAVTSVDAASATSAVGAALRPTDAGALPDSTTLSPAPATEVAGAPLLVAPRSQSSPARMSQTTQTTRLVSSDQKQVNLGASDAPDPRVSAARGADPSRRDVTRELNAKGPDSRPSPIVPSDAIAPPNNQPSQSLQREPPSPQSETSSTAVLRLGRLSVLSTLGENLVARISLEAPEALSKNLRVNLASPALYKSANIEYQSVIGTLVASIVSLPDGRKAVEIRSRQPIVDPYLDLLVELTSSEGRIVREYVFLLDGKRPSR